MAFWCECMSVCVRTPFSETCGRVFVTHGTAKRTGRAAFRLKSPERRSGVCGAAGGVGAQKNELRLREPSPPRRSLNELPTASLFSMPKWRLQLGFANCAKFFFFKFFNCFSPSLKTPACVAGCGESWCPSLEAGYPRTDTRVCNNTHSDRQTDRQIPGRGATATMPVRQKGTFNHVYFHFSSFCISTKRDADASFCVWLNPV